MTTVELYCVAICKGDYIASVEAGPFFNLQEAEAKRETLEAAHTQALLSCYWAVVKTELPFTIGGY